MRFERLSLLAFGHFQGHELDFSGQPSGLQLIYGNNEAGKSTALRAIRALLFGVPAQSQDTFLHDGKDIRLAATLVAGDKQLSFIRRKGRKNTLLAPDGQALSDSTLDPFLGGVDETLFGAMFGLDHESLRHGAQSLLAFEGKLGESLFGAGLGTTSVRRMLTRFRLQADDLFTSRGRSKRINQEVAEVRRAGELVVENSTSATSYLNEKAQLEHLELQVVELRERRRSLVQNKSELERRLRVLPLVAQRRSYLEQLAQLGALPVLPADAEHQRQHATKLLQEARARKEHATREMGRVQARLATISIDSKLLGVAADQMDAFAERLGSYRKARLDLPKRATELRLIQEDIGRQLRRLGREVSLEQLDELRLTKDEESRSRRLIREKTQYDTKLAANAVKLNRLESAVQVLKRQLSKQPAETETKPLERALVRAQKHVELEVQLEQAKAALTALDLRQRDAVEALSPCLVADALPPSGAKPEWTTTLAVPDETLSQYEQRFEANEQQADRIRAECLGLEERRVSLEQQLSEMEAHEAIPSDERLQQLRASRDSTIEQLSAILGPEQGALAPALRMHAAQLTTMLGDRVELTDTYVDRLRTLADRVAQRRAKEAAIGETQAQLQLREERLGAVIAARAKLDDEWRGMWRDSPFLLRSPREMRVALERAALLARTEKEREGALGNVRRLEHNLAQVVAELSEELARVGEQGRLLWESLGQFVQRLEGVLEERRGRNVKRRELSQRLELASEQLVECQKEQADLKEAGKTLRSDWQRVTKRLGLSKDAGPEDVSAALEALSEVFRKVDEAQGLERRIAAMERDNTLLGEDVQRLCAELGATEQPAEPIDTLARLLVEYRNMRTAAEERKRLQDELTQRQAVLDEAETELAHAQEILQALFDAASVHDVDALNRVLQTISREQELRAALDAEERKLVAQGEGASVDELVQQCQGLHSSSVQSEIAAVQEEASTLDRQWERLTSERASREQALGQLSKGAAVAAEDLEARVAKLKTSVRRYLRFRLAAGLLESEIERYREAHQGPVLRRAKVLFPELTLGRYTSLTVGFDAKDEPVLLCCTKDERQISIDGLSDGTRDQLYLSLRLASLEHYMQTNPAMPLVLDDVLIHFDDERAKAALKVLATFSLTTQVLFFTHHARLVELAKTVVDPEHLSLHQLPGVA